ncbi:hypothetical protein [Paenibacillus graminis]|uniref:hypothetical protein n=1 Tax=Paenibacillus graminis TaxID=189425 RepID=UPI002DBDDD9B|nr:hypothetical protein [Paenibacillus graminis]MEC0167368.1 hypothetical protein [Paenibacillus graminis]
MWFKTFGTILFGLIMIAFIADLSVVYSVHDSSGRAIEHAIDAGIVQSTISADAQEGHVQLQGDVLISTIKDRFRSSMNLSAGLENSVMKNSQLEVFLHYDSNGVPWVDVTFVTQVSFVLPGVHYPVNVRRVIPYESDYI